MLSLIRFATAFATTYLAFQTTALRAVPDQACSSACGNVSSTTVNDIVCHDDDFQGTAIGQAFQSCISCQMNSTAIDPKSGISDVQWALYNLRYALSSCLFGYPNSTSMASSSPCITDPACGLFSSGMEFDALSPNASPYGYCGGFVATSESACNTCLRQTGSDVFSSNFFTALSVGCSQMPTAGSLLSLGGSLFSTTPVVITSGSAATLSSASGSSSKALSLGAKAGIAFGVIVFLLLCGGFYIIYRGRQKRKAKLAALENRNSRNPWTGGGFPPTTALNTRWGGQLSTSDISPITPGGSESDAHITPYSSHYSSPVSARDMISMQSAYDWRQSNLSTAGVDGSVAGTPGLASNIELEKQKKQDSRGQMPQSLRVPGVGMQMTTEKDGGRAISVSVARI